MKRHTLAVEYRISKEESQAILIDALAQKIAELFRAGDRLVDMLGEDPTKTDVLEEEGAIARWKEARGTAT